ncbi:AAA family ATPase [Ottowia sp.]|uniref:bifunctional aminoglycoside phosphotransferase/ATP-binding protein n=1 Tax=Ottowia sp. TaxID=1898956 RepID=UPI002BF8EBCC|nr:AAA family ATPase [Ottowia sp.]HOB65921.1 AAA family ATPase [Ottowia sp.]HPZ58040.1 AAA family ATPase [Ottowia sp.]HQD48684.1 AAA family ATPase [Ottowia sp.]
MPTPLIAALRRTLGADTELIETHLSWLLLAGDDAYKLKKPLTLDFVDFASPEQRRAACEEELRINRRTAPHLYLDVVPVTGPPDAPQLGGSGQPLDWAVHMRRFPADALLAGRAARGNLRAAHIDALAREIAAFQARSDVAPPDSPYGDAATLAQLAQDNFKPLLGLQRLSGQRDLLLKLQHWTQAEAARLAPLMAARRAAGHVREGHGDLHLGNLLWLHGRPVLFDAIEFNPRLRWIDTACDIAFLFMDLHAHGLAPLAWRFLNAWLEQTGDFGAVARLPYDAVYRALVRAKVAALRAAQGADGAADEAARYVDLATRLAAPRRPWLALTMGVSGSGKSSQTQALVEQRGLVRVRADVERKRLFGLAPHASSASVPGGIYDEATSDRVFARLADVALGALDAGQPVLVDATFIRAARRAPFIALAQSLGVPWRILAFDAPEPVLRERVRQREAAGGDASEAGESVLASQLAHREPLTPAEAAHALVVDTQAPVDWAAWDAALPTH